VPELPEVEALALDLKGRLADRAIAKVHVVAINALKTFDPPVQALEGTLVEDVTATASSSTSRPRACT
jgi:formamidopyrimidine-DNA glycosylase